MRPEMVHHGVFLDTPQSQTHLGLIDFGHQVLLECRAGFQMLFHLNLDKTQFVLQLSKATHVDKFERGHTVCSLRRRISIFLGVLFNKTQEAKELPEVHEAQEKTNKKKDHYP